MAVVEAAADGVSLDDLIAHAEICDRVRLEPMEGALQGGKGCVDVSR